MNISLAESPSSQASGMDVSIERAALLKALSHHQSLIERRSSIPILSHVLLETKDTSSVFMTGTDLEMSLVEIVPAFVQRPGREAIAVHLFYDIVRKLPDRHPVVIRTLSPNQIIIKSGSAEFTLPTLPAEDFPAVHPADLPFHIKIPAKIFKQLIEDTRFSMSTEEARYSLNGIYFHNYQNQWRAVATDAHRLALSWIPFSSQEFSELPDVIVGRKTIQELSKILDECAQDISLSLSAHQLSLKFEGGLFSSRLLEGQFPDYWQAIPQSHPHEIEISVQEISQAVSRVGMVSFDKHPVIRFFFQPRELTLSANSQQHGSAMEKLAISYEGEEFSLGFNPKHFLDICQHIKGENLRFILKDSTSPVLFHDPQDEKVSYVLMPMRA